MSVPRLAPLLLALPLIAAGQCAPPSQVDAPLGDIAPGDSVTIVFRARVLDPLALPGAPVVANQGTVSQDGFAAILTDDPAVGGTADPTETTLVPEPDAPSAAAAALLSVVAWRRLRRS